MDTVRIEHRTAVPLWSVVLVALVAAGAAGGGVWWYAAQQGQPAATPAPGPPPAPLVVVQDPAPPLEAQPSRYAEELAFAYSPTQDPTPEIVEEFAGLMDRARAQYARSSELEIRDAVYHVWGLRHYGRPDIDLLAAFRLIVAWSPAEIRVLGNESATGRTITTDAQGRRTTQDSTGEAVSVSRLRVEDVPVARAVEAISADIVGAYNRALEAQYKAWAEHQEQQAAAWERERERQVKLREAQIRAQQEAAERQRRAVLEQEAWKHANSVYGQLTGRR